MLLQDGSHCLYLPCTSIMCVSPTSCLLVVEVRWRNPQIMMQWPEWLKIDNSDKIHCILHYIIHLLDKMILVTNICIANNKMNIFSCKLTPTWLAGTTRCVYTSTRKQEVVAPGGKRRENFPHVFVDCCLIPTLCWCLFSCVLFMVVITTLLVQHITSVNWCI